MLQNSGSAPKPDAAGNTCGERRLLPPSSYRTTGARCGLGLIQPLPALPASHSSGTDVRLQSENGGCFPCGRSDRCYPRGAAEWPASRSKKEPMSAASLLLTLRIDFSREFEFFAARAANLYGAFPPGNAAAVIDLHAPLGESKPVKWGALSPSLPARRKGRSRLQQPAPCDVATRQDRAAYRASGECAQQSVRTTPPVSSANDAATLTFVLTHPACLSPLNRGRTTKFGGFRKDTRQ